MIKHLALIMDGNRRWARKRAFLPWKGHEEGIKAVKESINFCLEKKIPVLTLYAFSLENLKRSKDELSYLFKLMLEQINIQSDDLVKKDVNIKFIGEKTYFPPTLQPAIENIENATRFCKTLNVNILFCYGGQQEIVQAAQQIAQRVSNGSLNANQINQKLFESFLWATAYPPPDLVIRTGGAQRLSNFLAYQTAYSELSFIDKFWPDITAADLEIQLKKFKQENRNFGA